MRPVWPALLLVGSLAACASSTAVPAPVSVPTPPARVDRTQVSLTDAGGQVLARATLEDDGGKDGRGRRVVSLVRIEPAERARAYEWVWCHLATDVVLLLPDGAAVEHPDLAATAALRPALAVVPPDVDAVIAGLGRLRRLRSRGGLLEAVPDLAPAGRGALLAALTTERGRWVLGPGPDGCPAGGDVDEALWPALATAAEAWPALEASEAVRILEAGLGLSHSAHRLGIVRALAGRAGLLPVTTLARAATSLAGEDGHALLHDLAWRPGLSATDAQAVLEVALGQDRTASREDVLASLVGPGEGRGLLDVPAIVAATARVSREAGHAALLGLARRAGLEAGDARRVLEGALAQERSAWREDVLAALVGPGEGRGLLDVPAIVAASAKVSREAAHDLLLGLARRARLGASDASTVLEASAALQGHAARVDVLLALVGKAPRPALVEAAAGLDRDSERKVMRALAGE